VWGKERRPLVEKLGAEAVEQHQHHAFFFDHNESLHLGDELGEARSGRKIHLPILAERPMTSYFQDYLTVGFFAGLGALLVMIMLGVASILRPNKPSAAKASTYECGVDPVGSGWSQTYVRYYIFGLLFVIFDVEAVFIFPWALEAGRFGWFGLIEIGAFILILLLGLVYAVRKGVLKWE
jgi:NADH-quinone oxidoreductase subunit A